MLLAKLWQLLGLSREHDHGYSTVRQLERIADALEKRNCNHAILERLAEMVQKIMATQAELAADLKAVLAQQQKTATEIQSVQSSVDTLNAKIVELEGIIAAGSTPTQELVDAVAAVKAQAQIVDDLIPDLPVTPPTV